MRAPAHIAHIWYNKRHMANMTQLRMLEELDAVLLVDKPAGIAFTSVVKTVKRKFNLVKVGHGGSLDAAASGLLVLLLGDANKFAGDIMGADRSYEGTIRLGLSTNTGDIQGTPEGAISPDAPLPSAQDVESALAELRGDIFQTEPRHCSVRREGSADYTVADTGEHSPFLSHVYRFAVDCSALDGARREDGTVTLPFTLRATKGVIVRALARDLGKALGCGACLETLRRTSVGKLQVADAVPFTKVLDAAAADFASLTKPVHKVLL